MAVKTHRITQKKSSVSIKKASPRRRSKVSVLLKVLALLALGGGGSYLFRSLSSSAPSPSVVSSPSSSPTLSPQSGNVQGFLQFSEKDPELIGSEVSHDSAASTDDSMASLEDSFNSEEIHDLLFISNILGDMTEKLLSREDLTSYIISKGFTPYEERRGHERSGFRRVISVREIEDEQRLVKEFYGSYLEFEDEYVFDRLYYGLKRKDQVFEHVVKEIDGSVHGKYIRRIIKDNYARWDFQDGTFIFVNGAYEGRGKDIVLVGKEFEIH